MGEQMNDQFPVLQSGRKRSIDNQKADQVRRVLWRAFQHGSLSEEEFASTLERLQFAGEVLEPTPPSNAGKSVAIEGGVPFGVAASIPVTFTTGGTPP